MADRDRAGAPAVDVIVAGGGPAGSAAAAVLACSGCRVLVLDRAVFPRRKPCGDYLNPGCDAVLGRLGLRREVEAAGARPVRGMRVVAPRGEAVTLSFRSGTGWGLPRRTLDHLLLAHAARMGARVVEGVRVVGVERERRSVRVHAERRDGTRQEAYRARLLIGADGLHSTVARAVGAEGPPRRGRYTVGAYLEGLASGNPGPGGDVGEIHLAPERYCGVAFLPGGLANVTIALGRSDLGAWRGEVEARYWAALETFPGLAGRLTHARRAGGFATSGPLAYWRRRCVADGVLLTGDAAAYIDPLTGQGVYLALRGAEIAARAALRALIRGDTSARALREYERERRREFGGVVLLSRTLQALAFRPALVHRALRRMAARPDLGAQLIGAVGNVERPSSVLRPAFIARALGCV